MVWKPLLGGIAYFRRLEPMLYIPVDLSALVLSLVEPFQWQRQFPFCHIMNELICVKVLSLCPSIHAWRALMRVYWSRF